MLKLSTATPGQIATKLFLHPLDPNMAATFDGRIWTRYVMYKRDVIGEWRELKKYRANNTKKKYNNPASNAKVRTSKRTRTFIDLPRSFTSVWYRSCSVVAGRFTLECYLGRTLESWEVCRHGTGGPDDHSYLNVSPGDAVNNMIDDLENGKSHTNLTYMIEAQNRIARIISNLTSTKPNETTQAAS